MHLGSIVVLGGFALYSRKAQIVLLDNAGVEGVEIEEQDDAIVESSLGVQHETTTVFGFAALPAERLLLTAIVIVTKHLFLCFFGRHLLLVRAQEFAGVEFVHQEPFVALGPCVLEGAEPEVASDGCQLLRERHDLQMHHQVVGQVGIGLSMVGQLLDVVKVLEESRQHVFIKVFSLLLKLSPCQITEVVVGLADQLLRI